MSKRVPIDPKHRKHWVGYQLKIRDKSFAGVARDGGVASVTLYQVFQRNYPKMERLLAAEIGMTAEELFPERYQAG